MRDWLKKVVTYYVQKDFNPLTDSLVAPIMIVLAILTGWGMNKNENTD